MKKYRIVLDVTELMPEEPNSPELIREIIRKHVIPGRFAIESCTITEVIDWTDPLNLHDIDEHPDFKVDTEVGEERNGWEAIPYELIENIAEGIDMTPEELCGKSKIEWEPLLKKTTGRGGKGYHDVEEFNKDDEEEYTVTLPQYPHLKVETTRNIDGTTTVHCVGTPEDVASFRKNIADHFKKTTEVEE